MLKRVWTHNLLRKVGGTYKYSITEPGRAAITMGLKLKSSSSSPNSLALSLDLPPREANPPSLASSSSSPGLA